MVPEDTTLSYPLTPRAYTYLSVSCQVAAAVQPPVVADSTPWFSAAVGPD